MFAHVFTNRLKCLLRTRELVFWTLVFPLLLAIFFNMSLRNIVTVETFHPIPVAVVNDGAYKKDASFRTALKSVSEGKGHVFNLTETTKESADKLLAGDKIEGYLTVGNGIRMTVTKSDFNQSIIKSFVDSYLQTSSAATSILTENPASYRKLADSLKTQKEYTKKATTGTANPDSSLNYFYTLIAMACLYGGFWGLKEVMDIQADLSHRAARVNLAPVHKLKTFLSSMLASFVINFSEILIFLAFLRYCLNIDFGPKTGLVILTSFAGCIVGLSLGAFISAIVKSGEGMKIGILIGVTMLGSFLSGMMYQNMKYIISKNAPIAGYLNPVNLLTDAFYCLYYYSTLNRYWLNIGLLGAFALVFCTGTYLIIRRQKYASL